MNEEKRIGGPISVSMRDNNTIGHIGHVYAGPPTPPNAIMQGDQQCGSLFDIVSETDTTLIVKSLQHTSTFSSSEPFWVVCVPNYLLKLERYDIGRSVSFGSIDESILEGVTLRKVGRRKI